MNICFQMILVCLILSTLGFTTGKPTGIGGGHGGGGIILLEVAMDKAMMRGLTPSTSSMECMMTSITRTLVK